MNVNARRGGILAGLLITVAVLACIAVIAGLTIARSVHVRSVSDKDGENVSIDTPAGHISIRAGDKGGRLALADVPSYPGARRKKSQGGGAVIEWTSRDGLSEKNLAVSGDEMVTDDKADEVLHYYQDQLPGWVVSHKQDGSIQLELAKDGFKRFVEIHEKSDGTHIGVASIGAPAAN